MMLGLPSSMLSAAASLAHFLDPWGAGRHFPASLSDSCYFDSDSDFLAWPEGNEPDPFFEARRA
jgi:hypothetical protein